LQGEVKKLGTKRSVNEAKRTPTDASFYSRKQRMLMYGKTPKLAPDVTVPDLSGDRALKEKGYKQ